MMRLLIDRYVIYDRCSGKRMDRRVSQKGLVLVRGETTFVGLEQTTS